MSGVKTIQCWPSGKTIHCSGTSENGITIHSERNDPVGRPAEFDDLYRIICENYAELFTANDVSACVSSMVHTIANAPDTWQQLEIDELELYSILSRDDWESALREESPDGAIVERDGVEWYVPEDERTAYLVNWSLPGCLPDGPGCVFSDIDEAWDCVNSAFNNALDERWEDLNEEQRDAWEEFVNTLNKQAEPATLQAPDGFSYWVQDYPLSYTSEIDNERFAECCPNAIKLDSESAWREACEEERIGPHVREAFEHWIVSSDLAQHLDEIGETVCELFPNVWVWGRTTTGQPMIQDGVFQRIGAKILDHRVELIGGGQ